MKNLIRYFTAFTFALIFASCNYITYIPRSKKNIRKEQPSMPLLESIVNFRLEYNRWPSSKVDLTSKGRKYYEAFDRFPYATLKFKIIDNNTMTFYFYDHIKDIEFTKTYDQVNLSSYHGRVRFYKENDKFIWKLKMQD